MAEKREIMARPTLPDEIKKARGTFRPGRANASANGLCEGASRRLRVAETLLDADSLAIYAEAIHRIEFDTPHVDGRHAMPSIDCLADIEAVEGGIDEMLRSIGASEHVRNVLSLHSSDLFRLILEQQARAA
jgi:hypothetical protein